MRAILCVLTLIIALTGCNQQKGKTAREWNPELSKDFPTNDTVDVQELGVEIYPGSKTPPGLPPMARTSVAGVATVECWRETSDSPESVGRYYKPLISAKAIESSKVGVTVEGTNLRGEKIRIIATRKAGATSTAIVITVTKKPG